MEIKPEASKRTRKMEIDNDTCFGPLDAFKMEIKEEPKTETAYDAFMGLNEFAVNTEVEQDEEKHTINQESCFQEENKIKIMETLHSSHKEKNTDEHVEGKILNKNMKVMTGQRPYKCEICFKQFSQIKSMKRHLKTHTGEKPYECEICFKQFIQTHNLKRHLKTHTGEKPLKFVLNNLFKHII
ncbi:unnamed protein product [Diabrotica balteata]|uniref:C2H2-type domain-containing protein n=1 Tax=Diabrotica balteata TaxID=107213 RepID=A0A9P0E4Y7_DIABA|nr:unnamed protein product [Diabrotica balteata]